MKALNTLLNRCATVFFACSAILLAVVVFVQNWNRIGWGAVPRLALISAGMTGAMVILVAAVLTDLMGLRTRFWVSIIFFAASIAFAMSMMNE